MADLEQIGYKSSSPTLKWGDVQNKGCLVEAHLFMWWPTDTVVPIEAILTTERRRAADEQAFIF